MTRRQVQVVLGLLWLLDAALQAQPFMFTRGFASQVIAPAATGQPALIAAPVTWAARVIAIDAPASNALFVAVQLLIGVGLLVSPRPRLALAASVVWALGVWYFGEGLGEVATGHTSLPTGAPGAAVLYASLAAAAWPRASRTTDPPASWLSAVWGALWITGAGLELIAGRSDQAPALAALAGGQAAIGLGALGTGRRAALALGAIASAGFWIVGEHLGQLSSGQATDPNTGPLLVLMAIALWPPAEACSRAARRTTATHQTIANDKGDSDRARDLDPTYPQRGRPARGRGRSLV